MRRLKNTLPLTTLKTLYNSLILPHLQYGLLLWGHNIKELIPIQKAAIRIIHKSKFRAHTEPLFKNLKLLKLQDMYNLSAAKFYYKYTHDTLPLYFTNIFRNELFQHNYQTRNKEQGIPHIPHHKLLESSPRYGIPSIVSELPHCIKSKLDTHSLHGFSTYYKNHLLSSYSETCSIINCYICSNS